MTTVQFDGRLGARIITEGTNASIAGALMISDTARGDRNTFRRLWRQSEWDSKLLLISCAVIISCRTSLGSEA